MGTIHRFAADTRGTVHVDRFTLAAAGVGMAVAAIYLFVFGVPAA
jgi:hypothetical protein